MPKTQDDDNTETEQITISPISKSEHFMPHLMKYIFDNKLGVLPYSVQADIRHYNIRDRVNEIDDRRIMLAQSSTKKVPRNLKKQLEALDDEYDKQRFKLSDQL